MKGVKTIDFEIPDEALDPLLETLKASGNWVMQNRANVERVYYDTFDWRVFHGGWILYREGSTLVGRPIGKPDRYQTCPARRPPVWPNEIKDGILKTEIGKVCKQRRLFAKLTCDLETAHYHLCDALDKTRLRLQVDRFVHGDDLPPLVRMRFIPLLGYENALQSSLEHLGQAGYHPADCDLGSNLFEKHQFDLRSTKQRLYQTIQAGQSLQRVISKQLLLLHREIIRQVPGIEADWDVEFVHQFRVAIRWSRALLSIFKKSLPEREAESAADILRDWGKRSNALRDLDVLLLDRKRYSTLLPQSMSGDLDLFFDSVTRRRKKVLRQFVQDLQSHDFHEDMRKLQTYYRYIGLDYPSHAANRAELLEQVQALLEKRYRKMTKLLKTCLDGAHESQLHRLRIQVKKLRYALTTFQSLFKPKPFRKGMRLLKKVQTILGNRHDLEWQRKSMLHACEPSQGRGLSQSCLRAIAMLAGVIHAHHQQSWHSVEEVGVALKHERLRALLHRPKLNLAEESA